MVKTFDEWKERVHTEATKFQACEFYLSDYGHRHLRIYRVLDDLSSGYNTARKMLSGLETRVEGLSPSDRKAFQDPEAQSCIDRLNDIADLEGPDFEYIAEWIANKIRICNREFDSPESPFQDNRRRFPFYSEWKGIEQTLKHLNIHFEYEYDEDVKISAVIVEDERAEIQKPTMFINI